MTRPNVERAWPSHGRPAIISPEPPVCWSDYPALFEMAETLLQARRDQFPKEISAGKITQEAANLELSAFENLVQTWRFICSGQGQPADHGADHILRNSLDESLTRIAAHVAQHGGFNPRLTDQAHSIIALRWHLEPGRQTIEMARLTHSIREDIRIERKAKEHA